MNLGNTQLKTNPSYTFAEKFLEAIVNKQMPSRYIVNKLYGPDMSRIVSDVLNTFLVYYSTDFGKPRKHFDSPSEIISKRLELEDDIQHYNLHSRITCFDLPSIKILEPYYGEYSQAVQKHLEQCFKLLLLRKCGISIAAHHNRVGAIVRKLRLDNDEPCKYVTIAVLHDTIEELLNYSVDERNSKYGLMRYQDFIDQYIPENIVTEICLITNHYDLILAHIKNDFHSGDLAFNKPNLIKELDNLIKCNISGLHPYFEKLIYLVQDIQLGNDLYNSLKWICYQNYIREMAEAAIRTNNYRIYIVKAVDLLDNCHGSDALDLRGKIRNILKLGIWAKQGYELSTTHSVVNNCVMEIYEEALDYSEFIILKYLLEEESRLDCLAAALSNILKLKSILFTDKSLSTSELFFEPPKRGSIK